MSTSSFLVDRPPPSVRGAQASRIFGREITNHIAPPFFGRPQSHRIDIFKDEQAEKPFLSRRPTPKGDRQKENERPQTAFIPAARRPAPPIGVAPVDLEEVNVQKVPFYSEDIFSHLRQTEGQSQPHYKSMSLSPDVNERTRGILVDWLVDVAVKFKLSSDTLFLTVNVLDRFLERNAVTRARLQLVGVAALFLASKYEEIYPPELKDFVLVTEKAFTRAELLDMEGKILSFLAFKLVFASPLSFLDRFSKIAKLDSKALSFARYLLELSLLETKVLKFLPSQIAAAAVFLAGKIVNRGQTLEDLARAVGHSDALIKEVCGEMVLLLQANERSSLSAVRRKYAQPKYSEVSRLRVNLPERF